MEHVITQSSCQIEGSERQRECTPTKERGQGSRETATEMRRKEDTALPTMHYIEVGARTDGSDLSAVPARSQVRLTDDCQVL